MIHYKEKFAERHIGTNSHSQAQMLQEIGVKSLELLIEQTIPQNIRLQKPLNLPAAKSEYDYLKDIKKIASKNKVFKSYIGQGYYNTITPKVILRNILENPGWYTQYTPYQAEISQGRLQALLNFQTMVIDLTGMEIANASLLDEATAAAEAMLMQFNLRTQLTDKHFFVSKEVFPQTIEVLQTRATPFGITLIIDDHRNIASHEGIFGALVQYPAANGPLYDYREFAQQAKEKNIKLTVAADILSLTLLTPPGEWGADIVIGSTQRFGVPMGFGGPHAAFFATKEQYKRSLPGRIIGVTEDQQGNYALRMALQTREQHIKRDKATSNICTAQALLAIMASMYAVYHGPKRLIHIAQNIHQLASTLANALTALGYQQTNSNFFDTIAVVCSQEQVNHIRAQASKQAINFHYQANKIIIAIDETTSKEDIQQLVNLFASVVDTSAPNIVQLSTTNKYISDVLKRKTSFLTHPVFNSHHSEHEMLRYIKSLESKDLSLCHSMISLGSCTMKLNATTEMIPVTWDEFANIHPFAPLEQVEGYLQLFQELEQWLSEITGFDAISLQPNSGAQGEYAGLMVIKAYLQDNNQAHRNITLIPASAHGTNPASAAMAGMKIVIVKCDENGNIDIQDLEQKAIAHQEHLACLMVTYPSTHGVFEESIVQICDIIHRHGGQVYMDGANMNAQVGLTSPANIGADVCHLNLHKTFCIPHGGGGPGVGPIGVAKHLTPYLPKHHFLPQSNDNKSTTAVSAAPWGSANILVIAHAYIALMGGEGLTDATKNAILNANYIKSQLEKYYPVLYTGSKNRCAHETILDCRAFKNFGIEAIDIAKRLMDYGFHAPTVSFPVPGTLMIEPTESESKDELDRFCEAMISIRSEIAAVETGNIDAKDNLLKNAPHTATVAVSHQWQHPYSREQAIFPLPWIKNNKFWPSISRVNDTLGDRTLICSCPPINSFTEIESLA